MRVDEIMLRMCESLPLESAQNPIETPAVPRIEPQAESPTTASPIVQAPLPVIETSHSLSPARDVAMSASPLESAPGSSLEHRPGKFKRFRQKLKRSVKKRIKSAGRILASPFRMLREAVLRRTYQMLREQQDLLHSLQVRQRENHDLHISHTVAVQTVQESLFAHQRSIQDSLRRAMDRLSRYEETQTESQKATTKALTELQSEHGALLQREHDVLLRALQKSNHSTFSHLQENRQSALAALQAVRDETVAELQRVQATIVAALQNAQHGTTAELQQFQQSAFAELNSGLQAAFNELSQGLQFALDEVKRHQTEAAIAQNSLQATLDSTSGVTWSTLEELRAASQHSVLDTESRIEQILRDTLGRQNSSMLDSESRIEQILRDMAGRQNSLEQSQKTLEQTQKTLVFEQRGQMSELRRIFAAALQKPAAENTSRELTVVSESAAEPDCRVCGGDLIFKFSLPVLRDRHKAQYHECRECRTLQVVEPYWLAEAYASEGEPLVDNPDTGRFVRNFTTYSYLRAFQRAGVIAAEPRMMDYGGGYGLLTNMLRSGGVDAWQCDPYVGRPFLSAEYHLSDLTSVPDGTFDVVTAFEVMEHLTHPHDAGRSWKRILNDQGSLVLTTSVYRPAVHNADWHYLCTNYGQHVTFWSRAGLSRFAADLGFNSVGYGPGDDGWAIVMSMKPEHELQAALADACKILADPAFTAEMTDGWKHGPSGPAFLQCSPTVHPVPGHRREAA